jgi:basic membrane protein A and related proteins
VKARTFMLLVAAALIAVVTLVVTGTSSARPAATPTAATPQAATQAPFKVALVTDIGGLDDRSFNFLANKGLQDAKKKFGIQGRVFISKSNADYIPNLSTAARQGYNLIIGVGFLMADSVSTAAKAFPRTKFAIIDNTGKAAGLKGKPTNVRGLLFKEQEAGYLVGYLAARQITAKPFGGNIMLGAVGGLKIPPVDRFIAGYYAGAKKANPKVKVVHAYSQDFVDQAKCKEQALNMIANGAGVVFQVAGQCGLGVLSAAKERKVFGIGVDADQGYLGQHVMTSATKKVDVAVLSTIGAAKASGANFGTNRDVIFNVKTGGVGYGKISSRISPALKTAVENIRKQIASGKIVVRAQAPPATTG